MKNQYNIIDLHCDALYKLQENKALNFYDANELDVNYINLKKGNVKVQAFAIFIDPEIPQEDKYRVALEQVDAFKNQVLTQKDIVHIKNWGDIHELKDTEIGAVLTLEGLDCVGNDLERVRHLINEGVLSIGMTWNDANLACDGIGEARGAGLTSFGYKVVEMCNANDCLVDVSHISLKGFDDVLNNAKHVIASHSNAKSIACHRRNLSDQQIRRLIEKDAQIHIVYLDAFVTDQFDQRDVEIVDIKAHLDHFIKLGAEKHLGLGSDFDGMTRKIIDLSNPSEVNLLVEMLEQEYDDTFVQDITYSNFVSYIERHF